MARIRVLIVDDSAFARKIIREILALSDLVEVVGTARDGEEALEMTRNLNPDLVICDLRMPNLDGVSFVRRQMLVKPLPILIVSAAAQDAAEVIEALWREFDGLGEDEVRRRLAMKRFDVRATKYARDWLAKRDELQLSIDVSALRSLAHQARESAREASRLALEANDFARRAKSIASEAGDPLEKALELGRSNSRSIKLALFLATVALTVAVACLVLIHPV